MVVKVVKSICSKLQLPCAGYFLEGYGGGGGFIYMTPDFGDTLSFIKDNKGCFILIFVIVIMFISQLVDSLWMHLKAHN